MPKKNIYRFKNRNNTKKNLKNKKNKKNKKIISKKNKNLKNKIVRKKSIKNKNIKSKSKTFKIKQYGGSYLGDLVAKVKNEFGPSAEQIKINLCKSLVPTYKKFVHEWHTGNFILIKVHGCIDKSKTETLSSRNIPQPLLFNQGLTRDPESNDFPVFMEGKDIHIVRFLQAQDIPIAPFRQDNDLLLSLKFKNHECREHNSNDFWYSLWYSKPAYASATQNPSLNHEEGQPALLPGPIFTDAEYLGRIISKIPVTKKSGYPLKGGRFIVQFSYSDLINTLKTENYISDATKVYLLCCTNDCPPESEYKPHAFSEMTGADDGLGAFSSTLITNPFHDAIEKSRRYIHSSSPSKEKRRNSKKYRHSPIYSRPARS